jgi:hypothetical protein
MITSGVMSLAARGKVILFLFADPQVAWETIDSSALIRLFGYPAQLTASED